MDNLNGSIYFWFIELLSYWQGQVNSSDVSKFFGISNTQAKKHISSYKLLCPNNLQYCNRQKSQIAQVDFQLHFINGDASEYLNWLNNHTLKSSNVYSAITHAELTLPPRNISPIIMRSLVNAIKQSRRLDVEYISLSNTVSEGRIIQPHTFVKTGLRWHLRGYCEARSAYRDFVLSRFSGKPFLMDAATQTIEGDLAWNTLVTLCFRPDPRLTEVQKRVIERDYQMKDGELKVTTKAALAQYLIQEMQVRTDSLAKTPQQQQLVLVNEDDLKPWLFS